MRARASADTALAVELARRTGIDELLELGMTDNHCWFMGFTTKERAAWEASDALVLPLHPAAILVKNDRAALFHGDKALSPLARFYGQKLRRRDARRIWQEREVRSSRED